MRVGRGTSTAVVERRAASSDMDKKSKQVKAHKDRERSKSRRGSSSSRSRSRSKHSQNGQHHHRRNKNTGSGSHRSGERSRGSSSKRRMPVIDRIPTAISYHSADSEEEWMEQKSKSSRYSGRYELGLSETYDEPDDRYSLAKRTKSTASSSKTSHLSNQKKATHIERLWSGDFSQIPERQPSALDSPKLTPKQIVMKQSSGSKDKYSKEGLVDPIYDAPKKKKETIGRGFSFDNYSTKKEEKISTKVGDSDQKEQSSDDRGKIRSSHKPRRRSVSKSPRSTHSRSSRSTGTRSRSRTKDGNKTKKRSGSTPKSHRSSTSRHRSSSRDRGRSESSRKRSHRRRSTSGKSHSSRSNSMRSNRSSRERHSHRRSKSAHSRSSRSSKSKSPSRDRHRQRLASETRKHKHTSSSRHSHSKHSHSSKASSRKVQQPLDENRPKWTSPPMSPANGSETSSLTDPLHNMLNSSTTDKVVKEIEHKLKVLKKAAAEEKAALKRAKKESRKKKGHSTTSASKSEVAIQEGVSKKPSSDSKIQKKLAGKKIPVLPNEQDEPLASPKDAVEMTRSSSDSTELLGEAFVSIEKKPTKKKMDRITAKNLNEVEVQKEQSTDETSQEQRDSLSKLESQHTHRSVNSSGRPFSKLFSKTKISVGPSGLGNVSKTTSEKMVHEGRNLVAPSGCVEGEPSAAMYTKSLFTAEESTTIAQSSPLYNASNRERQVTGSPSTPVSETSAMQRYVLSQSMHTEDADDGGRDDGNKKSNAWKLAWSKKEKKKVEGKTKDFVAKVAPSWKFGRKKSDIIPRSSSMKSIKLAKSSSFWKKDKSQGRKQEKTNSEPRKRNRKIQQDTAVLSDEGGHAAQAYNQKQADRLCIDPVALSTKSRNNNVAELDEYSVHEGDSNEPGLVQCLKFYSCGTLADKVNATIEAASCPCAFVDEEEDAGYATADEHYMPGTPEPAVEVVVLDNLLHQHEQTKGTKGSYKSVSSRHSLLSCGDANSWEEAIRSPPSYLIEVTDKQLRLDGDFFQARQLQNQQPVRNVHADESSIALKRTDFSITSVRIPQVQKQNMNSAKKKERKHNKIARGQVVCQGLEKSKSIDREEDAETDYNSSHGNEMEERNVYRPEDEYDNKSASHGRLQKLVSRFRKK